uniref:Claudin n=1 Tax=Salmo trutta TaxID=8032 RepID=A0A674DTZ8_SALTR
MSMGMEIVGIALGVIGFILGIVVCALPLWKVTAYIGANIITSQTIWEGLWMNCVTQSTGQMQCKVYDSLLALPQDLQAARAMTIIAIILGILGVMVSIVGAKCTNCFYNPLLINAQKRELGASLYIGWGAAALLLIGGAMLCSSCPPREEKRYKPPGMAYSAPRSGGTAGYGRKDYV